MRNRLSLVVGGFLLPSLAWADAVATDAAAPQHTTLFVVVLLMGLGAALYLAAER